MARYFLRFRHSDTGLTPTFLTFKKASDLSLVTPPGITEITAPLNGSYYFDYTPTFDIIFEVDGGASIPTEEVRYISDTISPKDTYVDEPTSQVKDDVWNDTANRAVTTKGDYVENIANIASTVWDATLAGHTTAGTFGQTLQLEDSGSVQTGGLSTEVKLRAGASAITNFYKNGLIAITSGTGVGQSRSITAYDGTTKLATIDRAWGTQPVAADGYIILPAAPSSGGAAPSAATVAAAVWDEVTSTHTTAGSFGQTLQLEDSGSVQTGGLSTEVKLRAGASAITDFYKNGLIAITSGTGIGQSRSITAYDGTTKIATVDRAWGTQPVVADGYIILPAAPSSGGAAPSAATVAAAVWDETVASHLTVGTTGLKLSETGSVANTASAVWDELTAGHDGFGSFGQTLQLQDSGSAKGGAATTITLRVGTSASNDFYKNGLIVITRNTGTGQARKITGYVGATRIATVDRAWDIIPITDDSEYMILPMVPSSSGGGSGVQFYANGDTVNPILVQVASPKHTQIKVTYSEPVVMTTGANGALNLGNYSVVGLTLLAVTQLTSQQVMLTTSAQTANFLYTIVVTNVEDLVGNPIL